ncbi:ABC transporter permease subunit [Spongiactinospora sp. TRM90649]|uniref:ABC transporter permease n=1 Tax=Spongiactinospora sp. TRM90649 TaxID=3031114 RepID=UPI0023F63BAD|nr:ABC transporter permease subunit [Spongiactinospora sp. TRM90649]MDF5752822.1 ABC transporter permease subunit [Spongiactinospora sp. TRM90649]
MTPRMRHHNRRSLAWISPSVLLIAAVITLPALRMVWTSLQLTDETGVSHGFAGLANYRRLLAEPALANVMSNTVVWVLLVVGASILVALGLAQLLNKRFFGRRLVRWALIVPWATSLVMTSTVWRYMLEGGNGIVNRFLMDLGVLSEPIGWYQDPRYAFWSVIGVGIVVTIPFTTYVLLAGLQAIDPQVYEAGKLDGAGPWKTYRYITLPLLRPALVIATILVTIYVFNSFPVIWVITGSNPGNFSDTTLTWAYKIAFQEQLNTGEGAALSVFNVLILIVVVLLYLRAVNGDRERRTWLGRTWTALADRLGERWSRQRPARPVSVALPDRARPKVWPRLRPVVLPLAGLAVAAFFLAPYAVMFLSSFKNGAELYAVPATYLPDRWEWSNWTNVWDVLPLAGLLRNSLIIAAASTALVLLIAVPAAYYTARNRFAGRTAFLNLVLVTQVLAPVALVVGIYQEVIFVDGVNQYWAIVVVNAAFNLAFVTWIMNGQFAGVDLAIEEAAMMEGLGPVRRMLRIMLPVVRPGLVTALVFTFIQVWNEFVISLTVFNDPTSGRVTLPVGIQQLVGLNQTNYQYLFVASLIATVPVVVLFITIERHLVGGLTAGSVK